MQEMFLLVFAMIIVSLGLLVYYIVHVVKNKGLSDTQRTMWILIIVFASGIGSIVYYFVEILPEDKAAASLAESSENG